MLQPWQIWVIVALFFIVIEIFTTGFAVACFSIGAIAAAVASALNMSLIWQILLFAVFTFLAFAFVRPLIMKSFYKPCNRETNANALIGRTGRVSSEIDPDRGYGRVAIDGDDWKAVSIDGGAIAKGAHVEVVSIDSVILTVKTI